MSQCRALKRWWNGAAMGVLALLFLAAGFWCLDADAMDHHGKQVELCCMAIAVPVDSASVGTLVLLGLAPTLGRPLFATIHVAVPKPPPRRIAARSS